MPSLLHLFVTAAMIALGAVGGVLAHWGGFPLPYLLGALLITALPAIFANHRFPADYGFPMRFRMPFIGLIGMVIGTQVTTDLFASLPTLAISMAAMVAFVVLAQLANYQIFRRIGGYDPATAFFAGAPGGLIESISMGETSGADIQLLVTQQFLRIILVMTLIPFGLSLWLGYPVGSAAGLSVARAPAAVSDWGILALGLAIGVIGGVKLGLPAGQLTGPLLVSALMSLAGYPVAVPGWLVSVAQIVVGTSLGLRFAGLNHKTLIRGFGLSLLSVSIMLLIGAILSAVIYPFVNQPADVLLITFAPGGVNEMALVALSLHANPAFVTLHHVFRIIITVLGLGLVSRRIMRAT